MRTFLSNIAVAGRTLTLPQVAAAQNILVDTIVDGVGDCNVTHGTEPELDDQIEIWSISAPKLQEPTARWVPLPMNQTDSFRADS